MYFKKCSQNRSDGFPERDILSLCAFGQGGGQISRVVRVSARAAFGVCRKIVFLCMQMLLLSEVVLMFSN